MDLRPFARPLPLILTFLFVAVAVADLVQKIGEGPEPPPQVGGSMAPRFVSYEPVLDFRPERTRHSVQILPVQDLDSGRWSDPEERGVWALGDTAGFDFELGVGGHRVFAVEARPAGGKRRVRRMRLEINGVDCGGIELTRGWSKYRLPLPEGVVRTGDNRVVLSFPDREKSTKTRRSLLLRKIGLFFDLESEVDGLAGGPPVSVDESSEKVVFHRSGTLEIPLILDDRTDALQMRYRFPSGAGGAEVTVSKASAETGVARDVLRASVNGAEEVKGRIRFPLHGRRGRYVLRIRAALDEPADQLLVTSLRLVEEGDPTRRPWTADQRPS